jgi:beta-glucosidase
MAVRNVSSVLLVAALLAGCSAGSDSPPQSRPGVDSTYLDPTLAVSARVENLLGQMTQAEKFGQMTQAEENSVAPGGIALLELGSVLHGGGSITQDGDKNAWATAVSAEQHEAVDSTHLGIPILYGIDAVHGFGSMYGATVFPQQIGLGAANDPKLMTAIGRATAIETSATGIRWDFSPVLAVVSDIRWGRTYESYSQDPARVARLGAAYIRGLQGSSLSDPTSVLATPKHFVGDGSTVLGLTADGQVGSSGLDQGNAPEDPVLLFGTLLPPYRAAIDAGAKSVMATFSSWGGQKVHGDSALLSRTLRNELGFDGFVVSDWGGCDQIKPGDYEASIAQCINAGVDMVMTPYDGAAFQAALAVGVDGGTIAQARIDEAVGRILTVKFEMGLFEHPYPDPAALDLVGSAENRALARKAVAESQVLLKNDGTLPLSDATPTILVVGNAADDMGVQAGGWTMTWQGTVGDVIPGATIAQGIRDRVGDAGTVLDTLPASGSVDVCIAVVGERPYAEGNGDSNELLLPGIDVLDQLAGRCDRTVLVVVSGRPVIITDALPRVNAVVAAWLPGTAGEGVADVLFGDRPFTGTLPMNWPRDIDQLPSVPPRGEYLFPLGFGLTD